MKTDHPNMGSAPVPLWWSAWNNMAAFARPAAPALDSADDWVRRALCNAGRDRTKALRSQLGEHQQDRLLTVAGYEMRADGEAICRPMQGRLIAGAPVAFR